MRIVRDEIKPGDDVNISGVVAEVTDGWLLVRLYTGVEVWVRKDDLKSWRAN